MNNNKKRERRLHRRQQRSNQQIPPVTPTQQVPTEEQHKGFPMPKLQHLLAITKVPSNWTMLEQYMLINGRKVQQHFPENQKMDTNGTYRNGVCLEKKNGLIHFTSYTPLDGRCVYNHKSVHSSTYGLLSGKVNMFDTEDEFRYYGDGSDYVNEYLDAMIKRAQAQESTDNSKASNNVPLQFWDVVVQSQESSGCAAAGPWPSLAPTSNSAPIEDVDSNKKPTADELSYEKRRKEMYMPDLLALLTRCGYTYEFKH